MKKFILLSVMFIVSFSNLFAQSLPPHATTLATERISGKLYGGFAKTSLFSESNYGLNIGLHQFYNKEKSKMYFGIDLNGSCLFSENSDVNFGFGMGPSLNWSPGHDDDFIASFSPQINIWGITTPEKSELEFFRGFSLLMDVQFLYFKNLGLGMRVAPTVGIIGDDNNNAFIFSQAHIYISYSLR